MQDERRAIDDLISAVEQVGEVPERPPAELVSDGETGSLVVQFSNAEVIYDDRGRATALVSPTTRTTIIRDDHGFIRGVERQREEIVRDDS